LQKKNKFLSAQDKIAFENIREGNSRKVARAICRQRVISKFLEGHSGNFNESRDDRQFKDKRFLVEVFYFAFF
jgi:hypothetical protein